MKLLQNKSLIIASNMKINDAFFFRFSFLKYNSPKTHFLRKFNLLCMIKRKHDENED